MDGLTIRNGQAIGASLLDTKKTDNELRTDSHSIGGTQNKTFADTLKDAVGQVNTLQKESDKKMQDLSTGKTTDIPDVMMSAEKADIALRLMTQVRNKIIQAYEDVMKMQV